MDELEQRLAAYRPTLDDAIGDHEVGADEPRSESGRRRWMLVAAACVMMVAIAGIGVVVTRNSGGQRVVMPPVPNTTAGPEPGPSTNASDEAMPSLDLDPSDPRPFLTYGFVSFIDGVQPADAPQLTIYPDGRVLRLLPSFADGEASGYELTELILSATELNEMVSAVNRAGLSTGGLQPIVPLPDDVVVMDGGNTLFVARNGDLWTSREIEQLDSVGHAGDSTVPGRVEFVELLQVLGPLFERDRPREIQSPPERWAIVSSPTDWTFNDPVWFGPDLSDIDWQVINSTSICAIHEQADWPFEPNTNPLVLDGRHVTRRPLLPHEQTCDDVAEMRRLLQLDTAVDESTDIDFTEVHDTARWNGGLVDGLIVGPRTNESEAALAIGTLGERNGCPVVEADEQVHLVVWKFGDERNSDVGIRFRNGDTVSFGGALSIGGGYHGRERLDRYLTDAAALAEVDRCLEDPSISGEIFIHQG